MENRSRRQKIDNHLEAILIERLTEIVMPLGVHGIKRVRDLIEILSADLPPGKKPIEDLHWDRLTQEDQDFAYQIIQQMHPYQDILLDLSPARFKKIMAQVRENIGGKK